MSTPEMQNSIRVALADDQALVRAGLRALLQQQGIVVVFEAEDGADLVLKLAQQARPKALRAPVQQRPW